MKKLVITDWSAILKCTRCGSEQVNRVYGGWNIGSSTISKCASCNCVTNHKIIAQVVDASEYDDFLADREPKIVVGTA